MRFVPIFTFIGVWVVGYGIYWLIRKRWDSKLRKAEREKVLRSMGSKE